MKILRLKSRIAEMKKKSLNEFSSKIEVAEERTNKLEEISIKTIQSEQQRK